VTVQASSRAGHYYGRYNEVTRYMRPYTVHVYTHVAVLRNWPSISGQYRLEGPRLIGCILGVVGRGFECDPWLVVS
jgi:adenosine deaminase